MNFIHFALWAAVAAAVRIKVRETVAEGRKRQYCRRELEIYETFVRDYGAFISEYDLRNVSGQIEGLRRFLR